MDDDTHYRRSRGDSAVSVAYHEMETERPPAKLDAAVLGMARDAARSDRTSTASRVRWYKPVAFIAVAGLGIALLLELTDTALQIPTAMPVNDSSVPTGPFEEAADAVASEIQRVESETAESLATSTGLLPGAAVTIDVGTDDAGVQQPADTRCSDEQRAQVTRWWPCIEDLEKRGLTQSAERELEALFRQHPQFTIPE